jgi:hypothetical protein
MFDLFDEFQVVSSVNSLAGAVLNGFQAGEDGFPIAQHVWFDFADFADFSDFVEKFLSRLTCSSH